MDFEFQAVDSLDKVPEKYQPLYEEVADGDNAGQFVVAEQFKGLVSDYAGTAKALQKARSEKKQAGDESAQRRQALKAYEGILDELGLDEDSKTADGLKAHIDSLMEQASNGKELKVSLDKVKEEMSKKHAKDLEAKDQEISKRDEALTRHLISDVATRALTQAKGSTELLLPHVKAHTKVMRNEDGEYTVRVLDASGEVRFNGAGEPMSVEDLVADMKTKESFARAFDSEAPSGSGATPGSTSKAPTGRKNTNMSSIDKISAGLKKSQAGRGR